MSGIPSATTQYLFASDFDQTLRFNDSGLVLSELLGIPNFLERIKGLSKIHLVQQGGELAYLLLHDPEYRRLALGSFGPIFSIIVLISSSVLPLTT